MRERALAFVRRERGLPGAPIVVEVPDRLDQAAVRDGLTDPPPGRPITADSRRQWWLEQIVGAVPLEAWLPLLGTPEEAVRTRFDDVARPAVRAGWAWAAVRQADRQWALAVLNTGTRLRVEELLPLLDDAERAAVLTARLPTIGPADVALLARYLSGWPAPWPELVALDVLGWLLAAVPGLNPLGNQATALLELIAFRFPLTGGAPAAVAAAVPLVDDNFWRSRLASVARTLRQTHPDPQGAAVTTADRVADQGQGDQAQDVLRPHAEQEYAAELTALAAADDRPRPPSWKLSPWAVVDYLLGTTLADGTVITAKYVGPRRLIEVAVSTLATDRAPGCCLGCRGRRRPGSPSTWRRPSRVTRRCWSRATSGTAEESVRYGWNYARLLSEGPTARALVASPVMTAMREGRVARIEELTRIPSDVQDALITILSEKTLPIPELATEVQAAKGFTVIATANNRDRGVNDLSSALRRRFNTVVLPLPASEAEEVEIVARRVAQLGTALELPQVPESLTEIRRVVQVFRELRSGMTADGRTKLKSPSGTLSTAEAISVITSGVALAAHFGDGVLRAGDIAAGILGSVIKDPAADRLVWAEYLEVVVRDRPDWSDFYRACREVSG